jgi:hypothetical protein
MTSLLRRRNSIALDIHGTGIIKSISESISKLGFDDLDTEDKVNALLTKLDTSKINYSNIYGTYDQNTVHRVISEYVLTSMASASTVSRPGSKLVTISRIIHDGSRETIFLNLEGVPLGRGTFNTIYNATKVDDDASKFVVKISKPLTSKNEFIEAFLELFIHAILVVYQLREKHLQKNTLIATLNIVSFNRATKEFITLMPKLDGTMSDYIRRVPLDSAKTEINKALMQISCSLTALQKDFEFNHGDCKSDNIFYISNESGKNKYCLADFGFSRIKLGDYILQGQIFDPTLGKFCGQYGKRHDIALLIYYIFTYNYIGDPRDSIEYQSAYREYSNKLKYTDLKEIAHIVTISGESTFRQEMFALYTEHIYTHSGMNLNDPKFNFYEPNEMAKFLVSEFGLSYDECSAVLEDNIPLYMDVAASRDPVVPSDVLSGGNRISRFKYRFGL